MKELQFRHDVFEEFYQLNAIALNDWHMVPYDLQRKMKPTGLICDHIWLQTDDRILVARMRNIFREAIDKRYVKCSVCGDDVDVGTRNFPKKKIGCTREGCLGVNTNAYPLDC